MENKTVTEGGGVKCGRPVTAWTATLMWPMTSPRSLTRHVRRVMSTGCSRFDK